MMRVIRRIQRFFLVLFPIDIWKLKEKSNKPLYRKAFYAKIDKLGGYIGNECTFKDIPVFPHGIKGVFISGSTIIGHECIIYQNVTIGNNMISGSEKQGAPIIGNNVLIGAGAIIIGKVKIGNNCRIGAGAIVSEDIPDNCVVVMNHPRIIQKDKIDNSNVWGDI